MNQQNAKGKTETHKKWYQKMMNRNEHWREPLIEQKSVEWNRNWETNELWNKETTKVEWRTEVRKTTERDVRKEKRQRRERGVERRK